MISYYENLKEIDGVIFGKIEEVNKKIENLKAEETKNGNLGLNSEEIKSQTKLRWDLEYEQISIQTEIKSIEPILKEPVIYK